MIHIAVSILNFNSSENTIACVDSLLAAKKSTTIDCNLSIFVADNQSCQAQQQLLQSLSDCPGLIVRQHERNLGFAAGHNRNIEAIYKQVLPDFIWVLNNDCVVGEGALSALLKCAKQHTDVAIWGASILDEDGETIQCAGGCFYNPWSSTYRQYGNQQPSSHLAILNNESFDYLSGASLFFPAQLLQTGFSILDSAKSAPRSSAWFNEDFFLYFEELDLAKRLKPEYKMAWCKAAIIRHTGGASTGTGSGQRSQMAEYHSSLSALKFTRLYYPRRLWVMAPLRYLLKCFQLTMKGEFHLIKQVTRAYHDFWFA